MVSMLPPELETLPKLKRSGDGWVACCPVHDDSSPSLTLRVADDGKILAHCHAGCDQTAIAEALGLRGQPSPATWTPAGDAIAVYDYRDESGQLLFQVCRTADKQFPQRRPDLTAKSGWRWQLGDTRRVLFRLPELLAGAGDGRSVCVTEGEKDALALVAAGKVATCNPGGAGKWRAEYAPFFRDTEVTVFADKDTPGQAHARTVAASLQGVARRVWIVEAADPHKDIAAHLAAGLPLAAVNVTRKPDELIVPDLAPDLQDILGLVMPPHMWLVEGLLERGERLMLTGTEGLGKTMLLRQLAVCLAAGIHPTLFTRIDPLKVLYVECENSLRQSRRKFRPMAEAVSRHGVTMGRGMLRMIFKPNGLNLPNADDAAWLLERVTAHAPDVLVIGPLYRLHLDNPNNEETARRVTIALDAARNLNDCGLLIEAHSGHGEAGQGRPIRPTGSSLYLRWPEFGLGLRSVNPADDQETRVHLAAWRGPRDEREWPRRLRRAYGTGWAWEPDAQEAS
jgi:hypothetical protein